jgi:hypothetical protein
MGLRHSRSSSVSALPPGAPSSAPENRSSAVRTSANLEPPSHAVRIACPMCHAILLPPPGAPLFRCPCGVTLSYANSIRRENELSSVLHEILVPAAGSGADTRSMRPLGSALEARLHFILAQMPPLDPQAQLLRMLIARLPRDADGIMRPEATELLGRLLERAAAEELLAAEGARSASSSAVGGAPRSLIDLLPTRVYKQPASAAQTDSSTLKSAAAAAAAATTISSEHTRCQICLSEYEEGDDLRTLPCFHSFHTSCVDKWLENKKLCPICKTDIGVGEQQGMWDAEGAE